VNVVVKVEAVYIFRVYEKIFTEGVRVKVLLIRKDRHHLNDDISVKKLLRYQGKGAELIMTGLDKPSKKALKKAIKVEKRKKRKAGG